MAESGTTRHITRTFNVTHRTQITHDSEEKLIKKFKMIDSVSNVNRSSRQKKATDEDAPTQVLAVMARSPTERTRHLCENEYPEKQCRAHFEKSYKRYFFMP